MLYFSPEFLESFFFFFNHTAVKLIDGRIHVVTDSKCNKAVLYGYFLTA